MASVVVELSPHIFGLRAQERCDVVQGETIPDGVAVYIPPQNIEAAITPNWGVDELGNTRTQKEYHLVRFSTKVISEPSQHWEHTDPENPDLSHDRETGEPYLQLCAYRGANQTLNGLDCFRIPVPMVEACINNPSTYNLEFLVDFLNEKATLKNNPLRAQISQQLDNTIILTGNPHCCSSGDFLKVIQKFDRGWLTVVPNVIVRNSGMGWTEAIDLDGLVGDAYALLDPETNMVVSASAAAVPVNCASALNILSRNQDGSVLVDSRSNTRYCSLTVDVHDPCGWGVGSHTLVNSNVSVRSTDARKINALVPTNESGTAAILLPYGAQVRVETEDKICGRYFVTPAKPYAVERLIADESSGSFQGTKD